MKKLLTGAATATLVVVLGLGGTCLVGCTGSGGSGGTSDGGQGATSATVKQLDFGVPLDFSTDTLKIGDSLEFTPTAAAYGYSEDAGEDVVLLTGTITNVGSGEVDVEAQYYVLMRQEHNSKIDDVAPVIDMGSAVQLNNAVSELPIAAGESKDVFFCCKVLEFDQGVTVEFEDKDTGETYNMPFISIDGLRTEESEGAEADVDSLRSATSYSGALVDVSAFPEGIHAWEASDDAVKLTDVENLANYLKFTIKSGDVESNVGSAVNQGGESPVEVVCNGVTWQYVRSVGSGSGVVTHKFFTETPSGACLQAIGYGIEYDTLIQILDATTIN